MKLPIPDDWNEEADGYILGLVCFPNSKYWRAIVRGQIQVLAYGRLWDEQTGNIKAVQAIGWEIYESFMTCKLDDLVTSLDNLNITVQGLSNRFVHNDKDVAELLTELSENTDLIEEGMGGLGTTLIGILSSLTGPGLPPSTLHGVMEDINNNVIRLLYVLDRLRDNLDTRVPGLGDEDEVGLATLTASFGPTFDKMRKSMECIAEATNSECEEPGEPTPPMSLDDLLQQALDMLLPDEANPPIVDVEPPEE